MTKFNTIKYHVFRLNKRNLMGIMVLTAIIYFLVSPLQNTAFGQADINSQKPALLAIAESTPIVMPVLEPVKQPCLNIIVQGSALVAQYNPANTNDDSKKNEPDSHVASIRKGVTVTAYSSTPDQTDDSPFITAMGSQVRDGIVAANFLRFGTKIRLPEIFGDKIFVVEDRMALRNSNKLDVWMESRENAIQFGVKHLTLEIIE